MPSEISRLANFANSQLRGLSQTLSDRFVEIGNQMQNQMLNNLEGSIQWRDHKVFQDQFIRDMGNNAKILEAGRKLATRK